MDDFLIGEFIGQGRQLVYCGLTFTTINAAQKLKTPLGNDLEHYKILADRVMVALGPRGRRPSSWFAAAIVTLLLVWTSVLTSFLVAFVTPTYGFGCWSACIPVYGILSSFTWVYHFFKKDPGPVTSYICHAFNTTALIWIIFTTALIVCISLHPVSLEGSPADHLQLTGGFNTCYCRTVQLSYPAWGGYMLLDTFSSMLKTSTW
jgi:hypothetical protein